METEREQLRPDATVLRPSIWLALVPRWDTLVVVAILLAGYVGVRAIWPGYQPRYLLLAAIALLVFDLVRAVLMVALFRYEKTATHISSTLGIVQRVRGEIALARVQHIGVRQSVAQRLTGTGTVDFTAADGMPVSWLWVDRPNEIAAAVREAVATIEALARRDEAFTATGASSLKLIGSDASHSDTSTFASFARAESFMTIGLVGGIGAGKSAVAKILSELGYVVLDADKDAKAALDLSHVRDQLTLWWGNDILDASGKVDRKKIAAIVFKDEVQRKRLESLVHPIVTNGRAASIAGAKREGKPGVVVDAPLLFEAGSEKDCDAVLFVDAPRSHRLSRVLERGWTEEEFNRRESAQMSLEEKKSRSHAVIVNDGDLATLRSRTCDALKELMHKR